MDLVLGLKFNQNEVNPICLLCHEEYESLQHFLTDCKSLEDIRQPIMSDFLRVLGDLHTRCSVAADSLLRLLVDSNIVLQDSDSRITSEIIILVETLHYHSRRLLYRLHATRYSKLELVPKRKRKRRGTATHT